MVEFEPVLPLFRSCNNFFLTFIITFEKMTCAYAEAVVLMFSIKKVFWKILENLQEYIYDGVVFWDPDRGIFL